MNLIIIITQSNVRKVTTNVYWTTENELQSQYRRTIQRINYKVQVEG
jgi:hypothetical protein